MQRGAQTQRTGPDHHDIGVHQAIVPYPAARADSARIWCRQDSRRDRWKDSLCSPRGNNINLIQSGTTPVSTGTLITPTIIQCQYNGPT